MKSEAFKILYALLSILFQFGRISTKISDLTYVALKWYVLILEGWKNWIWGCFTSLCASLLIPFYSNWTNLDESEWNLLNLLMWHRNDIFQWWKVEKMKSEAFKILYAHLCVVMRFYACFRVSPFHSLSCG